LCITDDQREKIENEEEKELIPSNLSLNSQRVKKCQFVTYCPPNVKDDMVSLDSFYNGGCTVRDEK